MAGDILNILSGFMKGKNKRRQEDLELQQLKLQTQSKLSAEKIALEKEKRAAAKDAQEQKFMDMFMQQLQGPETTSPGTAESTPMGDSFPEQEGPSLLDSLSRGQMGDTFKDLPPMESMIGGEQPQASPTSKMSPIAMALMKKYTGIDTLGAGRLEEQQASNKRLTEQGEQRIGIAQENLDLNRAKVIYLPQKDKSGATTMVGFDPLGKPTGQSFSSAGPPVKTIIVDTPDGGEGIQIINERTSEPMSGVVPTKHPPMPAAETASKVTLAMEAQNMIPKLKAMLWKDGKYDKGIVYQAAMPLGGVGEGRALKSMFMDALDARIRAATGAAVTKEEWPAYFRMYLPQILDSETLAKDKIKRLENFMSTYLETLDPKGIIRDRVKSTKQADFVFNIKTGALEPAK